MKTLLLSNSIFSMWREAMQTKNPFAFLMALWVTSLLLLFVFGFTFLVINWIMNPTMWDNVQFGIYDTLGT